MRAEQWWPGKTVTGVVRLPAGTIDASKTRGIKFERPERHVVNTPTAQLELAPGDWVITYPSGNRYVLKDIDFNREELLRTPWQVKVIRFLRKWGLR